MTWSYKLDPDPKNPRSFAMSLAGGTKITAYLERESLDVLVYEGPHTGQAFFVRVDMAAIEAIVASDVPAFVFSVQLSGGDGTKIAISTRHLTRAIARKNAQEHAAAKAADTRRQKAEQAKGGEA